MALWGVCFSEFNSSGESAGRPVEVPSGVSGGSGTEFQVGRPKFEEEIFDATISAPMEIPSNLDFCAAVGKLGTS